MALKILRLYLLWLLILLASAAFGFIFIPFHPGFTSASAGFNPWNFYQSWSNFDGLHYLLLARYGYRAPETFYLQAYFPVFPLLVSFLGRLLGDYLASGLLISHLSAVTAAYFLYRLLRLDYSKELSRTVLFALAFFPASFIFAAVYTESLFFLLVVLTFYFSRTRRWFLASLCVALASATRVTGIFLSLAVIIEFLIYCRDQGKRLVCQPSAAWFVLMPLGLFIYMRYLQGAVGDPFFFAKNQPLFGSYREIGRLVLPYQVFYRYLNMLIFVNHANPLFFTILLEAIIGGLFFILSILTLKKVRLSYMIFTLLSYLLPVLTGTFSSMPRYALILFPAFIILAQWLNKASPLVRRAYFFISFIGLVLATAFFIRGWFIT